MNCSATVVHKIAEWFTPERLAEFPNVDGVVAFSHSIGCGMEMTGEPMQLLRRTMAGYARHPNLAAALVIGLGCERNQLKGLMEQEQLVASPHLHTFIMQETGGTRKTIEAGIEAVRALLPEANKVQRQTVSASHLSVGLQCGGSDGFSSITANPALGAAVDILARHGGTGILSETPEIYGVEHTLTRRAASRAVGEKLIERIRWWKDEYSVGRDVQINGQVSPGNQVGGLANIFEKSLGSSMKGGTGPLMEVYRYAEPVTAKGFVFMDTPGFDPVSATGQIAGGANLIAFTTGRGSMFGSKPAPCIKLATNTPDVPRAGRGHGHQLRRDPRRHRVGAGDGPADLRAVPAHRVGRGVQEREARPGRPRVRAVADRHHELSGRRSNTSPLEARFDMSKSDKTIGRHRPRACARA